MTRECAEVSTAIVGTLGIMAVTWVAASALWACVRWYARYTEPFARQKRAWRRNEAWDTELERVVWGEHDRRAHQDFMNWSRSLRAGR